MDCQIKDMHDLELARVVCGARYNITQYVEDDDTEAQINEAKARNAETRRKIAALEQSGPPSLRQRTLEAMEKLLIQSAGDADELTRLRGKSIITVTTVAHIL